MDPDRAVAWYLSVWPAGRRDTIAGRPAFVAGMALLFDRVDAPPPGAFDPALGRSMPQSAFWHIGGFVHTTGVFEELAARGVTTLPLHTGPGEGARVLRSGQAPYRGIRTAAELAEAETTPSRPGGFGYLLGPDGALVELTGGERTQPSFRHVHLFHEEPHCAATWYVEVLGMTYPSRRDPSTGTAVAGVGREPCAVAERGEAGWPSLERAGTVRAPAARVVHANGSLGFYPRQCIRGRCGDDRPLAPSRGQVLDYVAFEVEGLDAWITHLRARGTCILEGPYPFGRGRGVLIEGPDRLTIELVELVR